MRTLALAGVAVSRGHECDLHSVALPPVLADRARRLGVGVVATQERAGSAEDGRRLRGAVADLLCVDGYQFGSGFFDALRIRSVPLMVVDDNRETPLGNIDIVLNQNPHARPSMYDDLGPALCLLGLDYALVRDEIRAEQIRAEAGPSGRGVLLSMGGADVGRLTSQLIEALLARTRLRLEVVVGVASSDADRVRAVISSRPDRVTEVPSAQLPAALSRTRLAVIAAGTTLWEAAALGVPTIALVVADNQATLASTQAVQSFAIVLDARSALDVTQVSAAVERLAADATLREEMRKCGRDLVDGRGADRAVTSIERLLAVKRMALDDV